MQLFIYTLFLSSDELRKQDEDDDNAEAYNFPAHSINYSEKERQRIGSITKENLLPASVQ